MNRKQPFTFEEFKEIYSKVPRLCVDLIIKTEKGVLLILRNKHGWEGQWHLPGGTVFYREKLEDAVMRIAQEELGVIVRIEKMIDYVEYFSELKERGFGYSVSVEFVCTLIPGSELNTEEQVEFFKTMPENMVVEQKEFLEKNVKLLD